MSLTDEDIITTRTAVTQPVSMADADQSDADADQTDADDDQNDSDADRTDS
jgi:hypothetical protein